jgi:hypothetical protein
MVIGTFYFNGALSSIQQTFPFSQKINARFKSKIIDFAHPWNGRVSTEFRFTETIPPGF